MNQLIIITTTMGRHVDGADFYSNCCDPVWTTLCAVNSRGSDSPTKFDPFS